MEIEVKYPLNNTKEVIARLEQLGAQEGILRDMQEDIYFTPAHRDFLDGDVVSEWLRLRKGKGGESVTFKRYLPLGSRYADHCDEYESTISDIKAMELMFEALDMKEIVRVHKERSTWRLEDTEVALDNVKGLGDFLEIEYKGEGTLEEARAHLQEVLQKLGAKVGEEDKRGYPYLLLGRDA